jgi:hypothetical protein
VVIAERQDTSSYSSRTDVYRLIEEHVIGEVTRTLYKGSSYQLGKEVSLDTLDEFANLLPVEKTGLDVPTLIKWDNVSGAYSDLAGQEAILDRIDHEVSLGGEKSDKSRPVSFAHASLFNDRGEVDLSGILPIQQGRMRDLESGDPGKLYGTIQPDFIANEIIAWIDFLTDYALLTMGYSKASYGRDQGGSADSGKALRLRQSRTLLKKAGKDRQSIEALTNALAVAMALADNGSRVRDYRADITLGDGLPRDPLEDAQEAQLWNQSGSISLEEKIRLRHPDWDQEAIEEEIAKIEGDMPQTVPPVPVGIEESENGAQQ